MRPSPLSPSTRTGARSRRTGARPNVGTGAPTPPTKRSTPLDVVTDAFFGKVITSEDNIGIKYAYVAAKGLKMPDGQGGWLEYDEEEGWRPSTDPSSRGS